MTQARSLRGIGDRLFDARLRTADGQALTVFADLAGRPAWLLRRTGTPDAHLPHPPPGLAAWCAGGEGPAPAPWQVLQADAAWLETLPMACVLVLDANLRIRGMHALDTLDTLPSATAYALGEAPVLVVPEVLDAALCRALVAHLRDACGGGDASGVLQVEDGRAVLREDAAIKRRRESPIRDPALEARVHEGLLRRALPEISRTLQFDVQRRDPFKLLAYDAGAGYFRPHRDNDTPDVAHRRFALSVNLDAGEYVGGAFHYPEFGPRQIAPPTGAALVFSCSLLHEVTPVEQGTRHALTTFLA